MIHKIKNKSKDEKTNISNKNLKNFNDTKSKNLQY